MRFQWLLEAVDDDDALSFSFVVSSCGVACEVQVEAADSLCRELWVGLGAGSGTQLRQRSKGGRVTKIIIIITTTITPTMMTYNKNNDNYDDDNDIENRIVIIIFQSGFIVTDVFSEQNK